MGFIVRNNDLEVLLALLLFCWSVLYIYMTKNYNYWRRKSVQYIKPCFLFGSSKDVVLGVKSAGELYEDFYKQFRQQPYFGAFEERTPVFVVKDPDLVKNILVKDFSHFHERGALFPFHSKEDFLSNHLFNMVGEQWRSLRVKLTSAFTSRKMKFMFLLMAKCSEQLKEHLENETKLNPLIDVKDVFGRFTMDVIATCAFGLETNSLSERESEFYQICVKVFNQETVLRRAKKFLYFNFPFLKNICSVTFISKDITKFIKTVVQDKVKQREDNTIVRNDFLELLLKIKQNQTLLKEDELRNGQPDFEGKKLSKHRGLTIEEMSAQVFLFLTAGFETASSTITFCLYELARHPEIQEKLYQEIRDVQQKHDNDLSYEALKQMTYMEQVINETLRLYPSLAVLRRTCTQKYRVPGTDLMLERGQQVIIPLYALHHDPQYFPDPHKFDPERFSLDKANERHPYVHLPFGEGPRMCIGTRFGMLQTKLGIAEMVSNFELRLSPGSEVPLTIHKTSLVTRPQKPIVLHLTKR